MQLNSEERVYTNVYAIHNSCCFTLLIPDVNKRRESLLATMQAMMMITKNT